MSTSLITIKLQIIVFLAIVIVNSHIFRVRYSKENGENIRINVWVTWYLKGSTIGDLRNTLSEMSILSHSSDKSNNSYANSNQIISVFANCSADGQVTTTTVLCSINVKQECRFKCETRFIASIKR